MEGVGKGVLVFCQVARGRFGRGGGKGDTWTEGLRQITVPGGIHMEVDAPGTDPQKAKAICL